MEDKVKWIVSETEVPSASDESLRRSLLTTDGAGARVKRAALDELLSRVGKAKDSPKDSLKS